MRCSLRRIFTPYGSASSLRARECSNISSKPEAYNPELRGWGRSGAGLVFLHDSDQTPMCSSLVAVGLWLLGPAGSVADDGKPALPSAWLSLRGPFSCSSSHYTLSTRAADLGSAAPYQHKGAAGDRRALVLIMSRGRTVAHRYLGRTLGRRRRLVHQRNGLPGRWFVAPVAASHWRCCWRKRRLLALIPAGWIRLGNCS